MQSVTITRKGGYIYPLVIARGAARLGLLFLVCLEPGVYCGRGVWAAFAATEAFAAAGSLGRRLLRPRSLDGSSLRPRGSGGHSLRPGRLDGGRRPGRLGGICSGWGVWAAFAATGEFRRHLLRSRSLDGRLLRPRELGAGIDHIKRLRHAAIRH